MIRDIYVEFLNITDKYKPKLPSVNKFVEGQTDRQTDRRRGRLLRGTLESE